MRGKERRPPAQHIFVGITPAGAGKRDSLLFFRRAVWDHPRRCGEKQQCSSGHVQTEGSPPQVRGKEFPSSPALLSNRITPAGAGKSRSKYARNLITRDHPRRCGEKTIHGRSWRSTPGSPPQVRGKGIVNDFALALFGITPAGAGKRPACRSHQTKTGDHPRRCGEKLILYTDRC